MLTRISKSSSQMKDNDECIKKVEQSINETIATLQELKTKLDSDFITINL